MSQSAMPLDLRPYPAAGIDRQKALDLGALFAGPVGDEQVWMRPEDYALLRDPRARKNVELQKRMCKGCGD